MPNKPQFTPADRFGLPPAGVNLLLEAREAVSQGVYATPSVSCASYPSTKTGYVMRLGSRTAEFVSGLNLEFDKRVGEWWDQPGQIKLTYKSSGGKTVAPWTRPDKLYFQKSRGWVIREDKHPDKIDHEAEKSPERYQKNKNGDWICPPGIEAARAMGMEYEVYVPKAADGVFFRNASWLEDFYLESKPLKPNKLAELASPVIKKLDENGGCARLDQLIGLVEDSSVLYRCIGQGVIHMNLARDLICRPSKTWVYSNRLIATTWQHIHGTRATQPLNSQLIEGERLSWEGKKWSILEANKNDCSMRADDGEFRSISRVQLLEARESGQIEFIKRSPADQAVTDILRATQPRDLKKARKRMKLLQRKITNPQKRIKKVSLRTLQRWQKAYRSFEQQFGCGFLGLLPRNRSKGNRNNRFTGRRAELIEYSLDKDYLADEEMTLYQAYALFKGRCLEQGIQPVTYASYRRRAVKRDLVERVQARSGRKAAYQRKAPLKRSPIPTEGDRPWEVAHLDHTRSNIVLRSAVTGEVLGNPWMTLLIDAKTRFPLARYYSFRKPSKVALMMVLRDCVYRNNRLPQRIVVDQGAEFNSIYFETFCAAYRVTKMSRPASEPRFGAIGERINGTIDTKYLTLLKGNSHRMKNPRAVSKSHNPHETSVWTPDAYLKQYDRFLFEEYPAFMHKEILEAPKDRFDRLQKLAGERSARYVKFDENFLIMTMLEATRGKRVIQTQGVSINSLRYWSDELKPYVNNKKKYPVRYDPMDFNRAFVRIKKSWIELECMSPIVQEYNELGVDDGLIELMERAREVGRQYLGVPDSYARFVLDAKRNEELQAANLNKIRNEEAEAEDDLDEAVSEDDDFEFETTIFDMEEVA